MSQPSVRFSSRLLSYLVSALLVWQPLLPAIGGHRPAGARQWTRLPTAYRW